MYYLAAGFFPNGDADGGGCSWRAPLGVFERVADPVEVGKQSALIT